ncbi:unnamed protein product [Ceratitis capitata]|uniref:(Mediterranean fruit fly) hypothetical protein n=1 Tax=Ceratitis capitata TaxID=7213 RepID=A0A811U895_CERCA|nr:unnamed protein product [Ceratitis capitata]
MPTFLLLSSSSSIRVNYGNLWSPAVRSSVWSSEMPMKERQTCLKTVVPAVTRNTLIPILFWLDKHTSSSYDDLLCLRINGVEKAEKNDGNNYQLVQRHTYSSNYLSSPE